MSFVSLPFMLFTAAALLLYHRLPRRGQNLLLLAVSYLFAASFSPRCAALLLAMTAGNRLLVAALATRRQARRWLVSGIAFNLAVWSCFKSAGFFVSGVRSLLAALGFADPGGGLALVVPIGLSFYTLQAISFLVDAYRGQAPARPPLVDFALYLAYFPKLAAGPIERPARFLAQLAGPRALNDESIARALCLLVTGLFRKVVVADTLLAAIPPGLFRSPAAYSAPELAAWLTAFAIGIYNDFCGYSDMARGISGWFGIELTRNFAVPYFSRSLSEFWSRWHISLSTWLRDYLFLPVAYACMRRLGTARKAFGVRVETAGYAAGTMLTMLGCGLWHGLDWSYAAWGLLHGFGLTLGIALRPARRRWAKLRLLPAFSAPARGLAALSTFAWVWLAWILFHPAPAVGAYLRGLVSSGAWAWPDSRVFLLILPSLWLDWVQNRNRDEYAILTWPRAARAFLLAAAVLLVFLFSQYRIAQPFIYQGF